MNRRIPRRTAGIALYELIVAIILFGVALHPLVRTLAANTRISTDRRDRLDAERVLRNETALLTAADPGLVPTVRSYQADRSGRASASGPFVVTTHRSVRCGIGAAPLDNAAAPPIAGCARGGVVVDYQVTVRFPRAAGSDDTGTASHTFTVAANGPRRGPIGALP
jgi:hypothetical protein